LNRTLHIQQTALLQRKYESKYFPKVKAVIKSEIDRVKSAVQAHGIHAGMNYLHGQFHSKGLPGVIEGLYKDVGLKFAQRQWSMLQSELRSAPKSVEVVMQLKGFGFNPTWTAFIKDFLQRFLLDKITFDVATTTRDMLINILQDAIDRGLGVDQIVKELDDLPLSETQAARIVRTEITRAANVGAMAAGDTFAYEQNKEWISAHDMRVRGYDPKDHASHVSLDGNKIDVEDVFIDPRNGDQLRFPGDPLASAASTINCRCAIALTAKRNASGRLIPKRQTTAVIFPNQRRTRQIVTV